MLGAIALASCRVSLAQSSTSAYSLVAANNPNTYFYIFNDQGTDGSPASAFATRSFTGKNGAGVTKTMTWTGSTVASSQFGKLRCVTRGTVNNSYYNTINPAFVTDQNATTINQNGSPSTLTSLGFAFFNDTLQFGGTLQAGYKARYLFHIDGTNSGTGWFGGLSFQIEGNEYENFFLFDAGYSNNIWATQSYPVNGITPQQVHVQFSTQVVFDLFNLTDGGNYSGVSDFSSTATLEAIEMVDANNNPVYGWTVTSGSGTVYPARNFDPATTATVSGTLILQGILGSAGGQTLDFEFRPNDGSDPVTRTAVVLPNGVFSLSGISRKNGILHISGARYLAKNVAVNATGGNVSNITATLKAGDANADNVADISDLLLLIAHYNQSTLSANYLSAADFNLDGINDITDLLLLIGNYNQLGEM